MNDMRITQQPWGFGSLYPEFVVNGETICTINTDEWTVIMHVDRDFTEAEKDFLITWREQREAARRPFPKPAVPAVESTPGGMRLRLVPEGVNPHQFAAQVAKARKLADALLQHGFTKADALLFDDAMWALAAQGAGVKPPSSVTQMMAIEELAVMERAA